jgi:prepilin-type N-terminal cleavage/methylation domain-containing protein
MFASLKNTKRGFTMIDLLAVIAIIGILSSVVLASLLTSRQKSRDAKRIFDLGQVQLALELYFDRTQSYPSSTPKICGPLGTLVCEGTSGATGNDAAIVGLADTKQKFLAKAPLPSGGGGTAVAYYYYGLLSTNLDCTGQVSCTRYSLGTTLERSDNTVLRSDADQPVPAGAFFGDSDNCGAALAVGKTEQCYDMRP